MLYFQSFQIALTFFIYFFLAFFLHYFWTYDMFKISLYNMCLHNSCIFSAKIFNKWFVLHLIHVEIMCAALGTELSLTS